MSNPRLLLILIPALPLAASLLTAILGARVLKEKSHLPTILAIGASFICSLMLLSTVNGLNADPEFKGEVIENLWTWMHVDGAMEQSNQLLAEQPVVATSGTNNFHIDVCLRADSLTAIMLAMVTFIATLVAIYAAGYMHGDQSYWRFFSYVSIFVFSMTMLVLVSNFLLLFVFWEAVGACSYLLIGFWYEKDEAAAAGIKAFLVNRVGDFGFALAIFLIWITYGTLNFHDTLTGAGVFGQARLAVENGYATGGLGLAICLLLMLGACGKSAQFPLHVWLPDAMEGPTPVSALIHAATMVTAGVYMVTRCTPLFQAAPDAQVVVASIGGFTALLAGLIALTQFDLKRVLAYSTISQLGYMFLALGTGTLAGVTAAMFHLFTHAFFKALLFLGAGSVMHSMGNVIDMRRFGGLRRIMPKTHLTFLIGCLALAGVFPFSGFWSKDAIVASVHDRAHEMSLEIDRRNGVFEDDGSHVDSRAPANDSDHEAHGAHAAPSPLLANLTVDQVRRNQSIYTILYWTSLFTAFLTAFYTFRALFMTFYGDEQIPDEAGDHAHESPPLMWVPLAILAVCAFGVGFMAEGTHAFASFLGHTPSLAYGSIQDTVAPGVFHMDIAVISSCVALAGIGLAAFLYLGHQREAEFLATALAPLQKISYGKFFFDELYNLCFVRPLKLLADASYFLDRWVIDGIVNLCGKLPVVMGGWIRKCQVGLVPFYGLAMVMGVLLLLLAGLFGGKG